MTKTVSLPNSNFARNGFRYDNHITATMIEDLLFDPILAADVLLDVQMPPHQELRTLMMWTHHFTMDDSGFSTGKSFTAAVVIAIRSMLLQGRISGVLSGTFRQGKLIFQYFDKWYSKSKLFRSTIKHQGGKPRLVHNQEAWEAHWRGGSQARVLPPNFLGDSTRLRSERWHDAYLDEWTTYGNFHSMTTTIFGRVTAYNDFRNCPVRGNHIHLFSTPGYEHQPAFKLVETIEKKIREGNRNYVRYTSNYRHIPRTQKWGPLVDLRTIRLMQDTNPPGVIGAEVDGMWQKESRSFYSSKYVESARADSDRYVYTLSRVNQHDIYVLGFDTARGESDRTRQADGDDFAACVLRIPEGRGVPYPCHMVRYNNIRADQMAGIIHELHRAYGLSAIVYDVGGGGLFVRDELAKAIQLIRGEQVQVFPLLDFGDTTGALGDQILTPFRRSSHFIKLTWGQMASDSVIVNRMHGTVRNNIQMSKIVMPPTWHDLSLDVDPTNADEVRNYLNSSTELSDLNRSVAELHLMTLQLMQVDVKRNKETGQPEVDSHQMYKFVSKSKKDAAYAFCYANVAHLVWQKMQECGYKSNRRGEGRSAFAAVARTF